MKRMEELKILNDVVMIDFLVGGSTGERTVESNEFIREVGRMLPKATFSWISKYRSGAKREILKVGVARKVDNRVLGYFVPVAQAKDLSKKLIEIRDAFLAEKEDFLKKVPDIVEKWAADPKNAVATHSGALQSELIRLHAPKSDELDKMLKFSMSATLVQSAGVFGQDDSIFTEMKGLAGQAAQEIAEDIRLSWKGPAGGRTTSRVLGLVRRIRDKANAMAILSPKFADLKAMCDRVLSAVPVSGTIDGIEFLQISSLLEFCQKPENILADRKVPFDPLDVEPPTSAEPEPELPQETLSLPLESVPAFEFGRTQALEQIPIGIPTLREPVQAPGRALLEF